MTAAAMSQTFLPAKQGSQAIRAAAQGPSLDARRRGSWPGARRSTVVGLARFVVTAALALLVVGDAAEALAQSLWSGKGAEPVLYAEASRRRAKRRHTPPPAPDPVAESAGEDEAASDASGGEGEAAAPEGAEGEAEGGDGGDGGEGTEAGGEAPPGEITGEGGSLRRSGRMDFDERLVKGQGARSGAVYLFKRTPRKLPELVALRTTYRERILQPVLRERALPAPTPAPTKVEATPEPAKAVPVAEESPPEKAPETRAAQQRRRKRGRLLRRRPQAQKMEQ